MNLIDLCAGTGAFSYVFCQNNKIKCIYANDILDSAEQIYNLNHTVKLHKQDIMTIKPINIPTHDILCCGFPCQSFSIAGQQKGFDDERSNIFWKLIEIIEYHRPNIVILENVKNLKSHDNGNTFKIILESLTKLNYYVKFSILNTSDITEIPQHRERIYIVCFKDKQLYDLFDFDFSKQQNRPISQFLEQNINKKYYYTENLKVYNEIKKCVVKHIDDNVIYQYRRYFVRENKNNVCPTLTCNMGTGGHNVPLLLDDNGIRKLTPRECFNLQGFPSDFILPDISDNKLYSLAGNSVTIPVIKLIYEKIITILDRLTNHQILQ